MANNNGLKQYLVNVSEVREEETEWVIPYWIPKGGITLLVGDGGVGKTNGWCYLVSKISGGLPTMLDDPDHERKFAPGLAAVINYTDKTIWELGPNRTCLYFSKEDSTARRLKKAFDLYGGDTENIHTIDIEHLQGLHYASAELAELIEELRPAICVFDPIQAFYPRGASMTSRQQSREALDHLIRLGQEYNTAFLLICHTNKRKTDDWRERISGSADLPDIARSIIFTGYTGFMIEREDGRKFKANFFSNEKNSYAPLQQTVLYTIEDGGRLNYAGESDKDFAGYAFAPSREQKPERQVTQTELCGERILSLLQENGEMTVKDLDETLLSTGFSAKICRIAKQNLEQKGFILRSQESIPDAETGKKTTHWIIRLKSPETKES